MSFFFQGAGSKDPPWEGLLTGLGNWFKNRGQKKFSNPIYCENDRTIVCYTHFVLSTTLLDLLIKTLKKKKCRSRMCWASTWHRGEHFSKFTVVASCSTTHRYIRPRCANNGRIYAVQHIDAGYQHTYK